MADILNIPILGKLEIVETYAYYDQPVLFSCKNAAGHLYLVVAADENDQYDTWFYAGVSTERLNHIRSGAIDLHDAFADPEDGFLFQAVAPYNDQNPLRIEPVQPSQISEDMFPISGERLNLKTETLPVLGSSEEIARSGRREVLNLTLNFDGVFTTEAPVALLSKILDRLQDVINRIGTVYFNSDRLTEYIRGEMGISLLEVGAGSFDIRLASTKSVDLFSDSDSGNAFGNAIEEFMKLLNAGSNQDELKRLLEQLKLKVAEDYTEFLQSLNESVIDTKFKWTSPNPGRGGIAFLSNPQMREAIEILQRFQEEVPSTFTITGTLMGAFLRSKRFEIETTEKTYTGDIADEAIETVSNATLSREYTATIQEITQRNEATDEITKPKYQLLSLR